MRDFLARWGRPSFPDRAIDRLALAVLNVLAMTVTAGYDGSTYIPYPTLFVVGHGVAGILLLGAVRWEKFVPWAFATTSGVFVGRALSIWMAIWVGDSIFPTATLALAGAQWAIMAYIIRPAHVVSVAVVPEIKEIIKTEEP